jgi:hypothetical protein
MECVVDAVIAECGDQVGLDVVLAAETVGALVGLDDGQLPTDGSFGPRYAGFPYVSLRSCVDVHHEAWARGREGWLYEKNARQVEHESHR